MPEISFTYVYLRSLLQQLPYIGALVIAIAYTARKQSINRRASNMAIGGFCVLLFPIFVSPLTSYLYGRLYPFTSTADRIRALQVVDWVQMSHSLLWSFIYAIAVGLLAKSIHILLSTGRPNQALNSDPTATSR